MRVQSIFILIPSLIGFFWFFAYSVFAPKDKLFSKLKRYILIVSFFFLFGFLSADPHAKMMLHFTLFEQVCALALVPCLLSYIYEYNGLTTRNLFHRLCNVLPFMHLIMGVESVYTAGYADSVQIYIDANTAHGPMFPYLANQGQMVFYACYTYMFGTFLLLNFLLFAINLMSCAINGNCRPADLVRFYFKRNSRVNLGPVMYFENLVMLLVIVPALLLGRKCYVDNTVITIAACLFLATFVFLIGLVGSAGYSQKISLNGLLRRIRFGDEQESDAQTVSEPDLTDTPSAPVHKYASYAALDDAQGMIAEPSALDDRAPGELFDESLGLEFEHFMLEKKVFLRNELTLGIVSEHLGVSKDTLCVYMDTTYGMSFSNYLNMLRVEYAEQYILDHDDATQKEIAVACGYSSASAFNSAFSKLTGVTPKIWKDRYSEMSRRNKTS